MDFVGIGIANPPPRRPAHNKPNAAASSSLPPLLPAGSDFAATLLSPRRHGDEFSPHSPRSESWCHLDKPQQQTAQVASWPLTFGPGSPRRGQTDSTADLDAFSPISPKVQKLHTRTRMVDDSRTRPALLQELQSFLHAELDGDKPGKNEPNLRRLQVVREALNRLITGFSVYAPVLMRIRDEYEHAVESLHAKSLMVPGLHTRLQSVETHCLRQLSTCSVEAKARSLKLKRRLAETQGLLAASAAENARLTTALKVEKENVKIVESKLEEVQRSTMVLASSIRRHDESLRAGHERQLEDARALQKVTARYYHACDELAELKQTIASLEEQGNGEHVAADKNTIVLLTREIQDLSAALAVKAADSNRLTSNQENEDSKHIALNHAFIGAMDNNGVALELPELMHIISSALSIPEGIHTTATMISHRLRQAQQQQFALLAPKVPAGEHNPLIFITEPAEIVEFNANSAEQVLRFVTPSTASSGDFLPGRGLGSDVPQYLQHDGLLRNLFFPRSKIEQIVSQVWDQVDEQSRASHNRGANRNPEVTALGATPGVSILNVALERFLNRCRAERLQFAYNFLVGLERFSSQSSTCRLFHLVLNQELPVEARSDHTRELTKLHDALVVVDRDRHFSNEANEETSTMPPGRVSLADVVRTLRLTFPWKSDAALSQLHRALLYDLRGQQQVDYATLLTHVPHVAGTNGAKPGADVRSKPALAKWQFAECLKMQRLDDLLAFRQHLQRQIRRHILDENELVSAQMISLHDLRGCLQSADPAMAEQDATKILTGVSGLSARELLTHDDMMLDVRQVLQRLPTMLLSPAGRFGEIKSQ